MSQTPEIIQRLERVLVDSLAMLTAASENRWDDLLALGERRKALMQEAADVPHQVFNSRLEQHKSRLKKEIAETDLRIQTLTRAWMNELNQVLTSVQVERKLAHAYSP